MRGNNNRVQGLTVLGSVDVPGNNNDVRANDFRGATSVSGNNNLR